MATATVQVADTIQTPITAFTDAGVYTLPRDLRFSETHYTRVAFHSDLAIKLPTRYALADYERYVVNEESMDGGIRANESSERASHFGELLAAFPEFQPTAHQHDSHTMHWLLIHRRQHQRLRALPAGTFRVPDARFVYVRERRFFREHIHPGIVQVRAYGVELWDMLTPGGPGAPPPRVRDEFQFLKEPVGRAIQAVAESEWADHINWYIRNFIYNPESRILWYIDSKPSNLIGRRTNAMNRVSLLRDFADVRHS
jgi:hypothetical protein